MNTEIIKIKSDIPGAHLYIRIIDGKHIGIISDRMPSNKDFKKLWALNSK